MALGKKTGGGSRKGVPNKANASLKEAIVHIVDSTRDDCLDWLKSVAEGQRELDPEFDEDGNPKLDDEGNPVGEEVWLRRPDPAAALKLWTDLAEFMQPKLARTEITGEGGGAVKVTGSIEFVTPVRRPVS